MTAKGRALENAVCAACKRYEREGRAYVKKNATPMRYLHGQWRFAEKADADFSGPVSGGGFFAGEAKEVHDDYFSIFDERKGLKPHQRERLEQAASTGGTAGLILGFLHRQPWEVYLIPIGELAKFLDAPWRRKFTPNMARVYGLLLPLGVSPAGGHVLVRFLDGAPHPLREEARRAVDADRMAHPLELPLEEPARTAKDTPLTGRGSPFDLLTIAKAARRKGVVGKKWGDRR